jgi:uncharacterized protein involved in exopolysaccharide biosynthesis
MELERLKREVNFKANLYNELQIKLAQTKLEFKKNEPIIKILEKPSPPIDQCGTAKLTLLFIFLIIGLIASSSIILFKFLLDRLMGNNINREKLAAIKYYLGTFVKMEKDNA